MDVENDLEEQLTSYHICKLPTEPPAPEAPIKIEKEESLPRKKVRPDDTNGKVERVSASGKKPKYRLEVFTVESAQQSPQEILGDEPEETVRNPPQRPAEEVMRRVTQKPEKSSEPDRSVIASNSRAAVIPPQQTPSAKPWYQLPTQEEVGTPPAISAPPLLIPSRVSPRATKGQAPLRLLDLPNRMQLLAPPESPPAPVQAPPPKSQRRRQIITSPPVACIKIEDDDDDDVRVVSSQPAPAPVPQVQPAIEARHVIKLVTSVPVSKYPCEFCGRTFTLWNQRDSHMNTKHRIDGEFTCFVCQKAAREYYITDDAIYSTEQYHFLQAHLAESHKITGQPRGFQCPYCSIHPANYEALVKHLTSDHDTTSLRNTYVLVNVLEDRIEG